MKQIFEQESCVETEDYKGKASCEKQDKKMGNEEEKEDGKRK